MGRILAIDGTHIIRNTIFLLYPRCAACFPALQCSVVPSGDVGHTTVPVWGPWTQVRAGSSYLLCSLCCLHSIYLKTKSRCDTHTYTLYTPWLNIRSLPTRKMHDSQQSLIYWIPSQFPLHLSHLTFIPHTIHVRSLKWPNGEISLDFIQHGFSAHV